MEGNSMKRYKRGRVSQSISKIGIAQGVNERSSKSNRKPNRQTNSSENTIIESGFAYGKYGKELNISILLSLKHN